jgi:hypothetical protein
LLLFPVNLDERVLSRNHFIDRYDKFLVHNKYILIAHLLLLTLDLILERHLLCLQSLDILPLAKNDGARVSNFFEVFDGKHGISIDVEGHLL